MTDRSKWQRLWPTLPALFLAAVLSASWAQTFDPDSRTVTVTPTGGDDTAALQTAFDLCLAVGPGCTVRLAPGTFYTRQLIIEGFVGTFEGAGMESSIIEPFGKLRVNTHETVIAEAPSDQNPWPVLLLFIDADLRMRDLGFLVSDPSPTTTWHIYGMDIEVLSALVVITGRSSRLDAERVSMESGEGSFFGVSVINGFYVQGVLGGPDGWSTEVGERTPLSGSFAIRESRFAGPDAGIAGYNLLNATLSIRDNLIDGVYSVFLEDLDGTTVDVAGNEIRAVGAALYMASGAHREQQTTTRLVLADNTVWVGPGGMGIQVLDEAEPARVAAFISDNLFDLEGAAAGIMGTGAPGLMVRGNAFVGHADVAIQVGAAPAEEGADDEGPAAQAAGWIIGQNDHGDLNTEVTAVWVTTNATGTVVVVCSASLVDDGVGTVTACH